MSKSHVRLVSWNITKSSGDALKRTVVSTLKKLCDGIVSNSKDCFQHPVDSMTAQIEVALWANWGTECTHLPVTEQHWHQFKVVFVSKELFFFNYKLSLKLLDFPLGEVCQRLCVENTAWAAGNTEMEPVGQCVSYDKDSFIVAILWHHSLKVP